VWWSVHLRHQIYRITNFHSLLRNGMHACCPWHSHKQSSLHGRYGRTQNFLKFIRHLIFVQDFILHWNLIRNLTCSSAQGITSRIVVSSVKWVCSTIYFKAPHFGNFQSFQTVPKVAVHMSCFPLTLRVECTAATDYQGTMKLAFPLAFPIAILLYSLVLY